MFTRTEKKVSQRRGEEEEEESGLCAFGLEVSRKSVRREETWDLFDITCLHSEEKSATKKDKKPFEAAALRHRYPPACVCVRACVALTIVTQ